MTCNEFQSLIMPFIQARLSIQKKEELLLHLSSCPKCAEELEIYYIIVNCIKGLDEEIDFPDNYHREYLKFIKAMEKEIKLFKKKSFRQRTALFAVTAVSVVLTGVSFRTETEESKEGQMKTKSLSESDLEMRFRFKDNHVYYDNALDLEKLKIIMNKRGR